VTWGRRKRAEDGEQNRTEQNRLRESLRVLWTYAVVASGTLLQGYSDWLGFFFFFNSVMLLHWRSSISKFSQFWAILKCEGRKIIMTLGI
jgi:hypothetical protein